MTRKRPSRSRPIKQEDLDAILEPKLPEGDIILTTGPLLGMGDHAVFSSLPERFARLGRDVYLDEDTQSSNPEIRDLIWKLNPFIKGLSDKKPNAGYVRQGHFYDIANRLQGYRSIEAMERAHGLPPPYGLAPKIYYTPKPTKVDVSKVVLVDFSAVSSKLSRDSVTRAIRMMRSKFKEPPLLQLLHPPWVVVNQERILESAYLVTSIYEYMDLLHACRAWVGSEAGGQSLAAAVRGEHDVYEDGIRPEICVTSTRQTYNSRGYTYRGVDYRVVASDGQEDYHNPLEVDVMKYEVSCEIRKVEMAQRLEKHG